MNKLATRVMSVAALLGAAGCADLDVTNVNSPDVDRTFSTPAQIEQLISSLYQTIHNGIHATSSSIVPAYQVMAFESYGTVANFGMATRSGMPRVALENSRGHREAIENFRVFAHMQQRAREAANGIRSLDALIGRGQSLGTNPLADNRGLNVRARAFALFASGVALGNVALAYDSAAVVTHMSLTATEEPLPPLRHAYEVMTAALAQLDSAEAQLTVVPAGVTVPAIPTSWINNDGNDMSVANFVRLIRSHRARFRAGVARDASARNNVTWSAVIADATNGITSDFIVRVGGGWGLTWLGSQMFADDSRGWHMMPMMVYGMADTSGNYATYIARPLAGETARNAGFLVMTPDRRWPAGTTRPEQRANSLVGAAFSGFLNAAPLPATGGAYIRNRPGQDTPGDPWGSSWYDFYRFKGVHAAGVQGAWLAMAKAEMDMLAAEGHIRAGNFAAASALINFWRDRAGLPLLTGITSLTQTVPGGNACVPRVPVNASPNGGGTTACGNIMEAMKYEKRMETAMTGFAQWFFDSRGWNDLAAGTALEFPVPYQEMDARTSPFYSLGGLGGASAAGTGTYGF
jgi:hypothetical protein